MGHWFLDCDIRPSARSLPAACDKSLGAPVLTGSMWGVRMRLLNALALLGISGLLAYAFVDQFLLSDLPCPLCLLQRVAFALAGFGFALNVLCRPRPSHYGLIIISALGGAMVAGRQVLLHIVPGSGTYGDTLFGLHFYSWAFVAFVAIIAGSTLLLMLGGDNGTTTAVGRDDARGPLSYVQKWIGRFAVLVFAMLVAMNALSTLLECSIGLCPDDPTHYELLG
jgi:disulfide bond formation protein DsbB